MIQTGLVYYIGQLSKALTARWSKMLFYLDFFVALLSLFPPVCIANRVAVHKVMYSQRTHGYKNCHLLLPLHFLRLQPAAAITHCLTQACGQSKPDSVWQPAPCSLALNHSNFILLLMNEPWDIWPVSDISAQVIHTAGRHNSPLRKISRWMYSELVDTKLELS